MKRKYVLNDLIKNLNVTGNLKDDEYKKFIHSNDFINQFCANGSMFFLFIDLVKMNYQYVSPSIKNVLGYSANLFLKSGVQFVFNIYHPSITLSQKAIHIEIDKFMEQIDTRERLNYKYSFDVKIKKADGNYIWLLQRNKFLKLDANGQPLLMFAVCIENTNHHDDDKQTLVVSKTERGKDKIVFKKHFFPEYENGILTRRETEVWGLMNEGYTSKIIGEKLNMKTNTVFTHRKKINKKLKSELKITTEV